jgi:hypothetical protein
MNMHYRIRYVLYVVCRKKHTLFRQNKTYQEYYNWVDTITLFSHEHNFYVMVTMCWPETE